MNYTIMALLGAKDIGLRSTMARAASDVNRGANQIEGAGKRTSKMALGLKAAMAGVAVVAASFLASGVKQAVAFEREMRNVNSISQLSEGALKALSNQVLELSTHVPQSAQTLAKGLYDVASSGFQGAAGMQVLEVSAKAASAGLSTTDVAAQAIVASLNAYGLSASDAADVSDILFQTVNVGVVTFEELASELGDVVGGAAAAGVALEEVGAATAAMTLSGLSAAESTTSLNRLIQSLIDPSAALAGTFTNLGFESGKAALDARGLHGTMELLRVATGGNIETLLQLFPEIRAARGAFALMAADGRNYATTFGAIADEQSRAGATQRAFNEQMKALGNQWDVFVNKVNVVAIKLGTALIPALRSGMQRLQEFGRGFGAVMSDLSVAAAPMVRSLGQAFKELARLAGEVYEAVQPIVKTLGVAFAGAAITAIRGLAEAFAAAAGVLADHPNLIRAIAIVLGSLLTVRLLAAAQAIMVLRGRALLLAASLRFGPLLASLTTRLTALGIGLRGLVTGNVVERTLGLGAAFRGLGRAIAGLAPAAAIAGIFGLIATMNKVDQKAKEMRESLEQRIDTSSMDAYTSSLRSVIDEARSNIGQFDGEIEGAGNRLQRFGEAARGAATLGLVDFENQALDARESVQELNAAIADSEGTLSVIEHDLSTVANSLGITREQAEKFFEQLDYDPTHGENFIEMREKIRQLITEMQTGSPAADQLSGAFETAGDLAQSASDRVDAFKDSLDALIGTMLGAFDAETAYAQGISDLTAAIAENGATLDAWSESGRANREALSGAVQAAIDWASEIATSTGSVQQGADALGLYRQQLVDTMTQQGFSRQQAEDYINTLGLTPENLQTVIELAGTAEATSAMGQVFDAISQLDLTVANPRVELDNLPFLTNAQAVGEFLIQVEQAAPEATVLLDDSVFRPTAAQVQAWAQMWDDASPQAVALLNIIDPQNRFATLSAAAARWDAAHPTATAGLQDFASSQLSGIRRALNDIDGRTVTASVNVRYTAFGDAAARIQAGKLGGRRWGGIHTAQTGLSWEAGVYTQPTIFFGERSTGGEAMIPRLGRHDRSMSILAKAADWYGADVVPRTEVRPVMGTSGGRSFTFAPVISVQVRADAGADQGRLAQMVRREVDSAVDTQWDKLRREVRAR